MIDLDQVVLRRAQEQVQQVRVITGDGTGVCACGRALASRPAVKGPAPKTCGSAPCLRARINAQRARARRSTEPARTTLPKMIVPGAT